MKVSTRGRYGLRAMLELGRHFGESPILMSTLADREGLSRKYLHALLTSLKSADLVQSVRGAGGGFVLARPPSEIRLSDILQAVEGPLSLVDCVSDERLCEKAGACTARQVWQGLSDAIERVLSTVTLQELIVSEASAEAAKTGRKGRRGAKASNGSSPPCGIADQLRSSVSAHGSAGS